MASTVYAPILICSATTIETNFKEFVVERRRKYFNCILSSPTIKATEGVQKGAGSFRYWEIVPVIFNDCIKGYTYVFRVGVRNTQGLVTWSLTQEQVAGDETPPAELDTDNIQLSVISTGVRVSIVDYVKVNGDIFEYYWDYGGISPLPDTVPKHRTASPLHIIPAEQEYHADEEMSGFTIYVWVRVMDLSGNVTQWIGASIVNGGITGAIKVIDGLKFES